MCQLLLEPKKSRARTRTPIRGDSYVHKPSWRPFLLIEHLRKRPKLNLVCASLSNKSVVYQWVRTKSVKKLLFVCITMWCPYLSSLWYIYNFPSDSKFALLLFRPPFPLPSTIWSRQPRRTNWILTSIWSASCKMLSVLISRTVRITPLSFFRSCSKTCVDLTLTLLLPDLFKNLRWFDACDHLIDDPG